MQAHIQPRFTEHQGRALWRSMRDDVHGQRLSLPSSVRTMVKLGALFLLLGAAVALSWSQRSFWSLTVAYVVVALLLAQFAFIGHDAGHKAISRRSAVNRAFGQISMTLVTGLAFDEWIGRHLEHHR